jgi:tRNA-2-methylthio-N6-dimethylallyladenosine synthase
MNRNYKRERFLDIVSALRDSLPNISITTDIIVGFPTESDEDFEETLDIVNQVQFQTSFCYKYSIRPKTPAKETFNLSDEIAEEIKSRRLTRLLDLQSQITLNCHNQLLGKEEDVLIESVGDDEFSFKGRTGSNIFAVINIPNLDSVASRTNLIAKVFRGTVVRASPHGLKLIESQEFNRMQSGYNENNNNSHLDY